MGLPSALMSRTAQVSCSVSRFFQKDGINSMLCILLDLPRLIDVVHFAGQYEVNTVVTVDAFPVGFFEVLQKVVGTRGNE